MVEEIFGGDVEKLEKQLCEALLKGPKTKKGEGVDGLKYPGRYMGLHVGEAKGHGTNDKQKARNQTSNSNRTVKKCKCGQKECEVEFNEANASKDFRWYYHSDEGLVCAAFVRARNSKDKWLAPLHRCVHKNKKCATGSAENDRYRCAGCKNDSTWLHFVDH